jgi:uncharacterized protein DUF5063
MPAREDEVVSAFLQAARAFRSALANDRSEKREFARRVRNAVARVYLAAASLPRGGGAAVTVDRGHSRALEERIRARLGDASLAQELAEIDDELARCVVWLEEPREPDALGDVWVAFEEHWGRHAVDVLRPLHHIARA